MTFHDLNHEYGLMIKQHPNNPSFAGVQVVDIEGTILASKVFHNGYRYVKFRGYGSVTFKSRYTCEGVVGGFSDEITFTVWFSPLLIRLIKNG